MIREMKNGVWGTRNRPAEYVQVCFLTDSEAWKYKNGLVSVRWGMCKEYRGDMHDMERSLKSGVMKKRIPAGASWVVVSLWVFHQGYFYHKDLERIYKL